MRKVVAGLFMTLDGVVESPGTWQEHFDEDMGEGLKRLNLLSSKTTRTGTVILTYQPRKP